MAHQGRDSGWIGRWSPGIGDPTLGGWVTVVAYFVAALLCWRVSRRSSVSKSERRVWTLLALALAALGVNKQLDLQTAFTATGRWLARSQGWYDVRGSVQSVFIAIVALAGLLVAVGLWRWSRRSPGSMRLSILGFVLLVVFVVVRAASFHHVDRFIGRGILGLRYNWVLENGGIVMVALGAYWRQAWRPTPAAHSEMASIAQPAVTALDARSVDARGVPDVDMGDARGVGNTDAPS